MRFGLYSDVEAFVRVRVCARARVCAVLCAPRPPQLHHEQTYKTIAFKTIVLYLNLTATLGTSCCPVAQACQPRSNMCGSAAAQAGRLLYMVDPETFAGVYKPSTVFFLQRMPQVLWLTETLLFIVLWKRVYDAYAKAERISSRVTIGRYKYSVTALSVILLGGGTVTCSLQAANIEPDLMQNIVIILVRRGRRKLLLRWCVRP